jgi:hypothetical protein
MDIISLISTHWSRGPFGPGPFFATKLLQKADSDQEPRINETLPRCVDLTQGAPYVLQKLLNYISYKQGYCGALEKQVDHCEHQDVEDHQISLDAVEGDPPKTVRKVCTDPRIGKSRKVLLVLMTLR